MVTASNDKTARLDVATGELLCLLLPSLGVGNEGKLYLAVISPDGRPVESRGVSVKPVGDQTATINRPSKRLCFLRYLSKINTSPAKP
ncbi:MAG: hypothetical protein M3Q33_05555 [Acidobacteriota bacterium]|nr:hypothetical protein [Acidobacteriota bacterium]